MSVCMNIYSCYTSFCYSLICSHPGPSARMVDEAIKKFGRTSTVVEKNDSLLLDRLVESAKVYMWLYDYIYITLYRCTHCIYHMA